jgi:hypothetical protein
MAEDSIIFGHCIQFHNTSILSTKPRHMDIIREAMELYPSSITRRMASASASHGNLTMCFLKDYGEVSLMKFSSLVLQWTV